MKYHIDTIPVWDAVKSDEPCPLCALRRKTERMLVSRSLGASVMSPDTRKMVNLLGFCPNHQKMLYQQPGGNRLGHALMTLSTLQETRKELEQILHIQANPTAGASLFSGILGRKAAGPSPTKDKAETCYLCQELDLQAVRQAESLIHLWKTEAPFREVFSKSRGLCLPDTLMLLNLASSRLKGDTLRSFQNVLRENLSSYLAALEEDLAFFTQKFDYRNADKPWGSAKDALERAVNALRGWCLGREPMAEDE